MTNGNALAGLRGGRTHRIELMDSLGSVVYAARLADGKIKIGHTERFGHRLRYLKAYTGQDVELIGFRLGSYEDEQAIHASLIEHRAQGAHYAQSREYYEAVPEVLAVVNDMRSHFGMPALAA